ncbi:MAG: TauD/TfdA family dioxygenase [Spirulinaceae cyanobacterium SM2_1_0]|nr:TauD/TfdA family dioxygenase [Spirulinaceae cyanobacterium SM2_1_0]
MYPERRETPLLALDPTTLLDRLRTTGVVLLQNFRASPDEFKQLSGQLSTNFMPYRGGAIPRAQVGNDSTVLAVTGSHLRYAVSLHGEMYYMKQRPSVIWFYCAVPAAEAGETTVADGELFYARLQPETRSLFASQDLVYWRTYPDGVWQRVYQTDDLDELARICAENEIEFELEAATRSLTTRSTRSAISTSRYTQNPVFINNILPLLDGIVGETTSYVRLADGSEIPTTVATELRSLAEELTIPIAWQPGDLLLIDNTRWLHGRHAYTDAKRDIHVRLGDIVA